MPRIRGASETDEGGRGLQLVTALSGAGAPATRRPESASGPSSHCSARRARQACPPTSWTFRSWTPRSSPRDLDELTSGGTRSSRALPPVADRQPRRPRAPRHRPGSATDPIRRAGTDVASWWMSASVPGERHPLPAPVGHDLRGDGQGRLLRGAGAQVEADGGPETRQLQLGDADFAQPVVAVQVRAPGAHRATSARPEAAARAAAAVRRTWRRG